MSDISWRSVVRPGTDGDGASLRLAGLAGIVLYPVFALTVVLLTWLEWDFMYGTGWTVMHEHKVNYPSTLALGNFGFVQSMNFLLLGLLAAVLGLGLRTQFTHRWSGWVATAGIAAVGLSGLFSAFVTDLPGEPVSWHGLVHGIGFLLLMLGSVITSVGSGLALRGASGWRGYWVYSLATTPLAVAISAVTSSRGQVSFYALITVLLTWYMVMGLRLRQLANPVNRSDNLK